MVLATITLAGCGDDAGSAGTADGGTAADAGDPAADNPAAAGGEPDADGTRMVSHAMGETEVPAAPQRVVVLDTPALDTAVALGVAPVATAVAFEGGGVPSYLVDDLPDLGEVGLIDTPSLEAVAAADPDLVVGARVRHEEIYDELSAIAPTVLTEESGTNWRDGYATVADALGRPDEGADLLAAYEERAAEVGDAVGADGTTASIVRFLAGETRLYGPDTFSGGVLTDVGFDLGDKGFDETEFSIVTVSPEQVDLVDADVVFATEFGDPAETTRGQVEELWGGLAAVAAGQQFDVEDDVWMLGIGIGGANLVLDDVESLLGS